MSINMVFCSFLKSERPDDGVRPRLVIGLAFS
jgi:hypothetical protein